MPTIALLKEEIVFFYIISHEENYVNNWTV